MMKRAPRRLGIFGGSFDPVHIGHVLLARWAREALRLDEVWLLPQAQSADGKRLSPPASRWQHLQRALRAEPGLRACALDLQLGGVSRAVDSLRALRRQLGPRTDFTWLLGQDQARRLPLWKEAGRLPKLTRFVYFPRPGGAPIPKSVHTSFRLSAIHSPSIEISSSRIRAEKKAGKRLDLAEISL